VVIGCEGHTWEVWEKNIRSIGAKNSYSEEEIDIVATLLTCLAIQVKAKFNYEENN